MPVNAPRCRVIRLSARCGGCACPALPGASQPPRVAGPACRSVDRTGRLSRKATVAVPSPDPAKMIQTVRARSCARSKTGRPGHPDSAADHIRNAQRPGSPPFAPALRRRADRRRTGSGRCHPACLPAGQTANAPPSEPGQGASDISGNGSRPGRGLRQIYAPVDARARGCGPPVAQSSNSTVWTTGIPVPDPICIMQPMLPAAMT